VPQQVRANETVQTKEDDDDLMVTFDKSTNFTQSNVSFNRHQPIPLADPIPARPIISITKTIDNCMRVVVCRIDMSKCSDLTLCFSLDTSAIRISWKFPEKSNHAEIASCRVFMLNEKKVRCVKNNNWIPVSGDTSRRSCTIPLVNALKIICDFSHYNRRDNINLVPTKSVCHRMHMLPYCGLSPNENP
jgi:hypothetical protein